MLVLGNVVFTFYFLLLTYANRHHQRTKPQPAG